MNNEWFFFALLAPALWSIIILIDDNLLRDVYKNPVFGTIISGLFGIVPVFALFFIPFQLPSTAVIILGLITGFLVVSSYWFYFSALKHESPSIVAALWNLYPALVPFLAFIFLQETVAINQYLGVAIVIGTSILLSLIDIKKFKFSRALLLMTIASVFLAVDSIAQKYIYNQVDFWSGFVFVSLGMGLAAIFFMISFKDGRSFINDFKKNFRKFIWIFVGAELINLLAILMMNYALSKGPATIVKSMEGVIPIYILILAFILAPFFPKFFREATEGAFRKRAILMIIMLFGLYLIYR